MEQNVRNLGVFVATLAMIASVLIVPGASASEHDLEITGSGDDGVTSYASQNGTASFEVDVTDDQAHTAVQIDASFPQEFSGGAVVTDCSDGTPADTLSGSDTITACISVDMAGTNAQVGETVEMNVSVTSTEDSDGTYAHFTISVSNWFAYSDDGVQAYTENATNSYTVNVTNLNSLANGMGKDTDEYIYISLSVATPGWSVDSTDVAWDGMMATIPGLGANETYNITFDIKLTGGYIPASSYVGNSFIVFGVNDGTVYTLVSLEASVADNLVVSVVGAGDQHVDNGCSDAAVSVTWDAVIKNFGNKPDSFSYTFDTSGMATGWTVDGAVNGNTGSLGAKYEGGEKTVSLGMWIPKDLSAGSTDGFTMTATSDADTSVTQTQSFSATVDQCYGMEMTVDPLMGSAVPGESADFTISVTNTGNGPDTISFVIMTANEEWSPTLSELELTVASGATGTTVFSMTAPSDSEANAGSGDAMIHAYSSDGVVEKSVTVSAKAGQVYGVTAGYYYNATTGDVPVTEGMSVQMKFNVTNTGNGLDDIALSLANAPEWITLEDAVASTAPGGTVTVLINVAAPLTGSVGDHVFQVVATSEDGTTTSTTGDLTATVTEKGTAGGPTTEELDEEEGGLPGFGALSAIVAIGAVLLIRRRL